MRGDARARGQRPHGDSVIHACAVAGEQVALRAGRAEERHAQRMKLFADPGAHLLEHGQLVFGRLAQVDNGDDVVDAGIRGREHAGGACVPRRQQLERAEPRSGHVTRDHARQLIARSGRQRRDELGSKPHERRQCHAHQPFQPIQRRRALAAPPGGFGDQDPRAKAAERIVRRARRGNGRRPFAIHGVKIADGEMHECSG